MRRGTIFACCLLAAVLGSTGAQAAGLGTVRIGVLKFGTVNWELDVIKHHGLDTKQDFTLDIQGYGGNDAADVALMGGAVDGIVEDWLWVSRQRASGALLTFIPYSSSVGAVMVAPDSKIAKLDDLEGKKIGVSGGPLDKGWILIQALAKDAYGVDLAKDAQPVYGAPPLLSEKLKSGELDAALNYWQYCARLEAEGYKRLIGVQDAQAGLGVPADTPQLGYIFHE
ncbi:MAG: ABC transporter substrate-binding protein, partial [Geminicoccales bacterium]